GRLMPAVRQTFPRSSTSPLIPRERSRERSFSPGWPGLSLRSPGAASWGFAGSAPATHPCTPPPCTLHKTKLSHPGRSFKQPSIVLPGRQSVRGIPAPAALQLVLDLVHLRSEAARVADDGVRVGPDALAEAPGLAGDLGQPRLQVRAPAGPDLLPDRGQEVPEALDRRPRLPLRPPGRAGRAPAPAPA